MEIIYNYFFITLLLGFYFIYISTTETKVVVKKTHTNNYHLCYNQK